VRPRSKMHWSNTQPEITRNVGSKYFNDLWCKRMEMIIKELEQGSLLILFRCAAADRVRYFVCGANPCEHAYKAHGVPKNRTQICKTLGSSVMTQICPTLLNGDMFEKAKIGQVCQHTDLIAPVAWS
jgi:hypothetical protein